MAKKTDENNEEEEESTEGKTYGDPIAEVNFK